jgi:cytochrome c oxidase assembly protein subunit 11
VASLLVLVALMTGFGFALVPLYSAFCRITGVNGRGVESVSAVYAGHVDTRRTVLVQFLASTASGLPFDFRPDVQEMRVHPGEIYAASFYAGNRSDARIQAQAVVSYAPGRAARYVRKTECFCFTREGFAPGESRHLPVRFYLDPALPPEVKVVTIAYTYYNVTPDGATAARRAD